jgi:hypothetical protein
MKIQALKNQPRQTKSSVNFFFEAQLHPILRQGPVFNPPMKHVLGKPTRLNDLTYHHPSA